MESLITHNPQDSYDSLGHQIKSKMKLLGDRFSKPLDYSVSGNLRFDQIWPKLYDCRSRIAHGGQLEFDGKLKPLKNIEVVETFITQATRRVIQQALKEPDLVLALRDC